MLPSIEPGFMVVHSNHPESLRALFVDWTRRHPLAPLEDEVVLVQSNGVAQWLKLALAEDATRGGQGIAAALRTELPARFLWEAYRAVLGDEIIARDAVPALEKPELVWRLMRLLPDLLREPEFTPLARFLSDDQDLRKRHQLAERLADLLDQYQVYRADWLEAWADGSNDIAVRGEMREVPAAQRWQPRLWRAVLQDIGPQAAAMGRAAIHRRFMDAVQTRGDSRPIGLPRRLVIFGISSLPQQTLEALAAIGRWTQVLMCVHNPCEHDWSHIVSDKDLLRQHARRRARRPGSEGDIPDDALHQHAHPLLAAWGKQGRDFIALLSDHDEVAAYSGRFAAVGQRIDCFDAEPGTHLLSQLQDDIRDLRPIAETRALWPAPGADDESIRFHITHSPQREVEVLHDQLLAAFAADPTLNPRDVIVMVPDITTYAPHIEAVFGLQDRSEARHIPYSIADRGQRSQDPLLAALQALLELPQSRFAASAVLDLLEVPALRRRFGIEDEDLPLLHRWIHTAGVRWGLHAEQRSSLGLPADVPQNTWDFGLQRMLLGYAVGAGEGWREIEPLDEVGGLDAALLGPLAKLLGALDAHWRQLATPATPGGWGARLRALLDDFFLREEDADGLTLMRLRDALGEWELRCIRAGLEEPLPLAVVREHWLASVEADSLSRPFFGGAVTFATLMPMRAIPFRHVALLGMNDGDYPRTRVPADFDLMAGDWRPGDRSRREDDRYLFLEALLSARDHLHISWVGRSIHDNTERPPSVLVAQLRDHLAAGWAHDEKSAKALLRALTVIHPLQPFHPDYFFEGGDPRLVSYASEWLAAPEAAGDQAPLTEQLPEGPLSIEDMVRFLKDPARHFMNRRLGVAFDEDAAADEDHEVFTLDALENWQLQDELITAQKLALVRAQPREEALAQALARMARRADLPAGAFGQLCQQELAEPMASVFKAWSDALLVWPDLLASQRVDWLPPGAPEALRLTDWVDNLRTNSEGARCRLLLTSTSLVDSKNQYRVDKLIPAWVHHLAAHLNGAPLTSIVISKKGTVTLLPLDLEVARELWRVLLSAWRVGLTRPLPLAPRTGLALVLEGDDAARKAYEGDGQFLLSERDKSPWMARAFPDFDALAAGGEIRPLTERLILPLREAINAPKAAPKKEPRA
ncbi:MAG: exodeoxyribonuclease V subunit gamma [Burkholderiaceae bacterium]